MKNRSIKGKDVAYIPEDFRNIFNMFLKHIAIDCNIPFQLLETPLIKDVVLEDKK